jgi:hypothetical protein
MEALSILSDVYSTYETYSLSDDSNLKSDVESRLFSSLKKNNIEYIGSVPYYTLYNLLCLHQTMLEDDEDCIVGVLGRAGKGKTTQAFVGSFYLDSIFTQERVIFDFKELLDFLQEAAIELQKEESQKGYRSYLRGIVLTIDEGVSIFFSSDVNTKQGRLATKLLTVIRFLNLFVFVCATNFERLNKLLRETRFRACLRIPEKGLLEFYSPKRTLQIQVDDSNTAVFPEPNFIESCGLLAKNNSFWLSYNSRKARFTVNTINSILQEVNK